MTQSSAAFFFVCEGYPTPQCVAALETTNPLACDTVDGRKSLKHLGYITKPI